VLEHPAYSHAWRAHDLQWPLTFGWWPADKFGGLSCHVEQGHYGHVARKPTWLYVARVNPPEMIWGAAEQRIPDVAIERHGYKKARRMGVLAWSCGGRKKYQLRAQTPEVFRDLLIALARSVK
jgi:hypothetical protein